jgi:hypothetical protein
MREQWYMTLQEVRSVLNGISDTPVDKLDGQKLRRQLDECLSVLRRETAFQPIPPGASTPIMRYELVDAEEAVALALDKLGENNAYAMLTYVQEASAKLSQAAKSAPEA